MFSFLFFFFPRLLDCLRILISFIFFAYSPFITFLCFGLLYLYRKLEFLVTMCQRNSTDTTNTVNDELALVNDTLAGLQATILAVKKNIAN